MTRTLLALTPLASLALTSLVLSSAGCSDAAMTSAENAGSYDESADSGAIASASPALRVDVRPQGSDGYLPQSFSLLGGHDWTNVKFQLAPTITVWGRVTGFDASPYRDISVPGEPDTPVLAEISVTRDDTIAGGTLNSDENGQYALQVPRGGSYQLSVLPIHPTELPFLIERATFHENTTRDFDLGYGSPIYGMVTDSDGSPLVDPPLVRLLDAQTDIAGPATQSDASGHYMLRANPGDYTLQVLGDDGDYLPTIELDVTLDEEGLSELDVDVGYIEPFFVSGTLTSPDGDRIFDGIVRFSSQILADTPGVSVVETRTNSSGRFAAQLLPGEWTAVFIPPYAPDGVSSPLTMDMTVSDDNLSLGSIMLPPRVTFDGRITDMFGDPVPYARVTARELYYNGATYTATADERGDYTLDVPDAGIEIIVTPPDAELAVARFLVSAPADSTSDFALNRGRALTGQVVGDGDAPAPFALVELVGPSGEIWASTLTDDQGTFTVRIDQ